MSEIEMYVVNREGVRLDSLHRANLTGITWELNAPGTAAFSIDPMEDAATQIRWPNEIQILFDGELIWWGVPWSITGNSRQINVTCEGLLSLFRTRFIDRTSLIYTSIDQFAIAWNVLDYAQSEAVEANRDFNIGAEFDPSGVIRSREWKRDEHENIYDILQTFAADELKNGFDWEIAVTPDGGRFWTPYYPRKGSLKENYTIQWEAGEGERNVSDFSWTENYTNLATLAYVTGGSVTSGDITFKKEGKFEDEDASAVYGQMQSIMSEGSELDENFLEDRAEQEVARRKDPEIITEITTARTLSMDAFGEIVVGDRVPMKIDHGRIQVDAERRVTKIAWNENDTLTFTLGKLVEL